jgi:hypothetical protein
MRSWHPLRCPIPASPGPSDYAPRRRRPIPLRGAPRATLRGAVYTGSLLDRKVKAVSLQHIEELADGYRMEGG